MGKAVGKAISFVFTLAMLIGMLPLSATVIRADEPAAAVPEPTAAETPEDGPELIPAGIEEEEGDVPTEYVVLINVTDMEGEELDGAGLVVKSASGEVLGEWTSKSGMALLITLEEGEYILEQTAAPTGHEQILTEIGFTVSEDGLVTVNTPEVEPAGACAFRDGALTLMNERIPDERTPGIRAAVQVGNEAAADGKAVQVPYEMLDNVQISDTVFYEGLLPGTVYLVTGTLVETEAGEDGGSVPVAESAQEFAADLGGTGAWILSFDELSLEPGKTYVVFVNVISLDDEDQKVTEEMPLVYADTDDMAQTILTADVETDPDDWAVLPAEYEPHEEAVLPAEEEPDEQVPVIPGGNTNGTADSDGTKGGSPNKETGGKTPASAAGSTTIRSGSNAAGTARNTASSHVAQSVQTGDNSSSLLYTGLLGAAVAVMCIAVRRRRRA